VFYIHESDASSPTPKRSAEYRYYDTAIPAAQVHSNAQEQVSRQGDLGYDMATILADRFHHDIREQLGRWEGENNMNPVVFTENNSSNRQSEETIKTSDLFNASNLTSSVGTISLELIKQPEGNNSKHQREVVVHPFLTDVSKAEYDELKKKAKSGELTNESVKVISPPNAKEVIERASSVDALK
jgi:hypothetical protein